MFKPSSFVGFLFGMVIFLLACDPPKRVLEHSITKDIDNKKSYEYAIVIHGGAGWMTPETVSKKQGEKLLVALSQALSVGENILISGGSAIDAVEQTINFLEDNPNFNAGKGAVLTADGTNELDASIMVGSNHKAGAIGGVKTIKNPISAARKVMENSEHVMMVGQGAEQFAQKNGLDIVDPSYFRTAKSEEALEKAKRNEYKDAKHGTVGCVALDKHGVIVAGTSTGGMTNKKYNRIGDSPIIGAGTYADERCGISCTGHGEYFIRYTVAKDIAARVEYLNESIDKSANTVIDKLAKINGNGGVIALDKNGNITMPFNTPGMYRGYARPGESMVAIFD